MDKRTKNRDTLSAFMALLERTTARSSHRSRLNPAAVARFASLVREAMTRFSRDGWKRHASWLLAELGRQIDVPGTFLFKNYPDRSGTLTAVRLYSWENPVRPITSQRIDYRVISYDADPFSALRVDLESGRAASIERIDLVPVHAGDEWWGVLGLHRGGDDEELSHVVVELARLVAATLGDSIRDASVHQALRWSERLHRIQRDIAMAAGYRESTDESLAELLALVCEFGDFDGAAVDVLQDGVSRRVTSHGVLPGGTSGDWCSACRAAAFDPGDPREPRYFGSEDLAHAGPCRLRDEGFHAVAVIPLGGEGPDGGAMTLFSRRRTNVPTTVRRSLEAVGAEVSMLLSRVRSEHAFHLIAERYRLAVSAGKIGVWEYRGARREFAIDRPTAALFLSPFDGPDTEAQLVVPREELIDRLSAADREAFVAWLDRAGGGGTDAGAGQFERECRVRLPSGQHRWVVIRAKSADNPVPRVVGTILDVTPMKLVQIELQRARQEADELSQAKSTFMARMTHEFRTPLNAVIGYVQVLRDEHDRGMPDPDAATRSFDHIEQSARRLLAMVENILDQNRLENGTLAIRPIPVDAMGLFDGLAETGSVLARDRGIDFELDVEEPPPARLLLDSGRVRQVLLNLISNAVKYADRGTVRLRIRWRDGRLRLAVSDRGPGIAPADRGRVFLPFRRREGDDSAGTGLGLAISQDLVQLMGSRIWLASILGRGSTFWFTIAAPGDSTASDRLAAPFAAGARRPTSGRSSGKEGVFEGELLAASLEVADDVLDALERHARVGDVGSIVDLAADAEARGDANRFLRETGARARALDVRSVRTLVELARAKRSGEGGGAP